MGASPVLITLSVCAVADAVATIRSFQFLDRNLVNRRIPLGKIQLHIAHLPDAHRILHRLIEPDERFLHLIRALEIKLGRIFQPVLLVQQPPHADAAQHIVRKVIFLFQEVNVVGPDETDAEPLGEVAQLRIDLILLFDVPLHLDVKPLRPEDIEIRLGDFLRRLHVPLHERRRHFSAQAGAGGDDAFGIFAQHFLIDAGLVIKPFAIGGARQLQQVFVPLQILRQQQQMIRRFPRVPARRRALSPVARRHVRFHADDRLDPLLFAFVVKIDHAEHAAVIGDRDRVHPQLFGPRHELIHPAGAVEQGVMRVNVQMYK